MSEKSLKGECLNQGEASGSVLHANVGLSFMGGIDSATGVVTDTHHPLHGQSVGGKILALPSGRGSCAGSLVIFELLMNGHAPAALIFQHEEPILTLGVVIAIELFDRGIPVVRLSRENFDAVAGIGHATVRGAEVMLSAREGTLRPPTTSIPDLNLSGFRLGAKDRQMLSGDCGKAAQLAMRIIIRAAQMENVDSLVSVDMAHIDGCFYQGPASLLFANGLCALGARVRVPSSMNALRVDRRKWREQGVAEALGILSDEVAEAYVAMGVQPTYTCAPNLLDPLPAFNQQIAWAESNAVVFANSVLGKRTMKYPNHLDILVAITGRAPNVGCHAPDNRLATIRIDLSPIDKVHDAYFALLGYHVGKIATNEVPVICGLEDIEVNQANLKAFGAAFATTSAAAMFHVLGVTPEATTFEQATGASDPLATHVCTPTELQETWAELNTAVTPDVDLVSLDNPHFSLSECRALASLCAGRKKHDGVTLIITLGRHIYSQAEAEGLVETICEFGGVFLNDTCWCLIGDSIIDGHVRNIATNSGKYAHYGPAAVRRNFHFAILERCVDAACSGEIDTSKPLWLS